MSRKNKETKIEIKEKKEAKNELTWPIAFSGKGDFDDKEKKYVLPREFKSSEVREIEGTVIYHYLALVV